MSPTYTGSVAPGLEVDPRIVPFFEKFYAISDNPAESAHEEYATSLTDDGTLIMGSKVGKGHDEILALRKGLWSGPVKTRLHTLSKIYPFGNSSNDVMIYGSVNYGLKNGKELTVDWSGHAVFTDVDGKLRMKFYQVYLDSAPVATAAKD